MTYEDVWHNVTVIAGTTVSVSYYAGDAYLTWTLKSENLSTLSDIQLIQTDPTREAILYKAFPYLYHNTFIERCLGNHCIKFGWELTSPEPKKWQFFLSCQTNIGGHIGHDVMGNPLVTQKMQKWKMAPKYWNFCDDKNFWKYTLKFS